jgi:hypothetical protein
MRALAGELLLTAWEEGAAQPELRRPLGLLSVALPDRDCDQLEWLPLAERNRLLLHLHQLTFGPRLDIVGTCTACDAQFEFSVTVAELTALSDGHDAGETISWSEAGRAFRLRCATTADLLATLELADARAAEDLVLSRCLLAAPEDVASHPSASPTVVEKFGELHAATELTCAITCPGCAREEIVDLDVARFLWTEVRRRATRLLREIHTLAAAYGWSERSILAMDPRRREVYLELLGA